MNLLSRKHLRTLGSMAALLAFAPLISGCPPRGEGRVTFALRADSAAKADVPIEDILKFLVTVTGIELDGEDGPVRAYDGAQDLDLLNLIGVSEVLSSAELPPGNYTKIRLEIEDPRLILAADPETVITDIQLTASGRLFVNKDVAIPADEDVLIVLDFGGIKLVEQGSGRYTLTPQLDADVAVTSAAATVTGTIASVDADELQLILSLETGDITVDFDNAAIFLPTYTGTPTGAPGDLAVGAQVTVAGTVFVDGSVAADTVTLLAE